MRVMARKRQNRSGRVLFLLATVLGFELAVLAEQLPLKRYTASDGLIRDYISRIVLDSHGFLWFCTPEGLSRFDGYSFTNYGEADGLPGSVRDLLQASDGAYWVATRSGVYRFDPGGSEQIGPARKNRPATPSKSLADIRARKFVFYGPGDNGSAPSVNTVKQDRSGVIW